MASCVGSYRRGALIVLEGCDKAGKTTQSKLLVQAFQNEGIPSRFMCFPDRSTQIGHLLDNYLKCNNNIEDHAIHLLFSANRWEAVPLMKELLNQGATLIIDRYAFSGVAFSAAKKNLTVEWCKQCDIGLPKPDLVLYFELPMEEAIKRTTFGEERYEQVKIQERVMNNFAVLHDETFRRIDANRPMDVIHREVKSYVTQCLMESQHKPLGSLWMDSPQTCNSNGYLR